MNVQVPPLTKDCDLMPLQELNSNTIESRQVLNTLHLSVASDPRHVSSPDRSASLLEEQITCSPMQRVSLFFQSDPEKKRLEQLRYRLQNYASKLTLFRRQVANQNENAERIFRQNSTIVCPRRLYQLQLWGRFSLIPIFKRHDELILQHNSVICLLLRMSDHLIEKRLTETEALIHVVKLRTSNFVERRKSSRDTRSFSSLSSSKSFSQKLEEAADQKKKDIEVAIGSANKNVEDVVKLPRRDSMLEDVNVLVEETTMFIQPIENYLLSNPEYASLLSRRSKLEHRYRKIVRKLRVVLPWLNIAAKRRHAEDLQRLLNRKERERLRFRKTFVLNKPSQNTTDRNVDSLDDIRSVSFNSFDSSATLSASSSFSNMSTISENSNEGSQNPTRQIEPMPARKVTRRATLYELQNMFTDMETQTQPHFLPEPLDLNSPKKVTPTPNRESERVRVDRIALSFESVAFDARLEEGRLVRSWFRKIMSVVHKAHQARLKEKNKERGKEFKGDLSSQLSGDNDDWEAVPSFYAVEDSFLPAPNSIIAFIHYFGEVLQRRYDVPAELHGALYALCSQQLFLRLAPVCKLYSQDLVRERDRLWRKQTALGGWIHNLTPQKLGVKPSLDSFRKYTAAIHVMRDMQDCFEPSHLKASLLGMIQLVYSEAKEAKRSIVNEDVVQEKMKSNTDKEKSKPKSSVREITLGMEDIFPILTYVLIQSGVARIHEIFAFMENFCEPSGEVDYYLTALQSNVTFIISLTKEVINEVGSENFERRVRTNSEGADGNGKSALRERRLELEKARHDREKQEQQLNNISSKTNENENEGGERRTSECVDLHLPQNQERDSKAMEEMEQWLIKKSAKEEILQTLF